MVYSRAGSSDLFSPSAVALLTSCARAFPVCVLDHFKEDWYQLMVVRKSSVGKGGFRGGPGDPGPPFCRYLILQHYMSNMESRRLLTVICMDNRKAGFLLSMAKLKRPECSRLHLRKLQSQKFSSRSMSTKLPRKGRRSQSWWALSRPHCHCILSLEAPSITKSSVRLC